MLGSNSTSTSTSNNDSQDKSNIDRIIKNSSNSNETSNKKSKSKNKNSQENYMKLLPKRNSPNKPKRESLKRLRTIESFWISTPKAKRVKNLEINVYEDNVNDNNRNINKIKTEIAKEGKDEETSVIKIEKKEKNNENNIERNDVILINNNDLKENKINVIEQNEEINKKVKVKNVKSMKENKEESKEINTKEKEKENFNNESNDIEFKEQNNKGKEKIKKENNDEEIIIKQENEIININEDKLADSSGFVSDSSIDTLSSLSSFSSSDLNIDSGVEARLNSQSSSVSTGDTETNIDEKMEKGNNEKVKSNKIKNLIKKENNNKEDTQKSPANKTKNLIKNRNKKDESKKGKNSKKNDEKNIKSESKKEKRNKKANINDDKKDDNKTVSINNSTNIKNKNKINLDDIPDNEIVELKNKRVIFYEKKIQIETLSETLIELLCFHEYKNTQNEPISKIPERFNSLIAKLVQDSDATENNLVNSVYQSLSPTDEDDEDEKNEPVLLKSAVLSAIRNVSVRKNYGIEKEGSYYPNLAIFRWEVKNLEWLTKNIQEKIKFRRLRRERALEILKKIVDNMSEDERNNLFRGKKRKSLIVDENKTNEIKESNANSEQKYFEEKNDKMNDKKSDKKNDSSSKDNEKRKIDQLQGQRSIAGFFSPIKRKKVEEKIIPETVQEKQNMEFNDRFKSFFIKSNTKVAPMNYFQDIKVKYNFEDDAMDVDNEDVSLENYLSIIRERKMKNLIKIRKQEKEKLKMESDIIDLSEGGVIPHYKMKLLQFFENHRPAYYGTWRKSTKIISGRRPFKKDVELLDYDFDSEIEWVADEEGEECLSDEEDEEEDIIESQYEQGDDDGWLVPHGYLSDDEGVEEDIDKINKLDKKNDPKPTKVVPLVPIIVGPIYAENSYDEIPKDINLAQYAVQLIDLDIDTPLDPFKVYPSNDDDNANSNEDNDKKLKIVFPEEYLSVFVKIVQYSLKGMIKIIDEAKELKEFKNIPKIQIEKKLREIAVKEKPLGVSKMCWCVKDEVYKKLNISRPEIPESLKIENTITSPKKNKSIFKNIKLPSNNGKKKLLKEPLLNFLPKKKTSSNSNSTETNNTIIIK